MSSPDQTAQSLAWQASDVQISYLCKLYKVKQIQIPEGSDQYHIKMLSLSLLLKNSWERVCRICCLSIHLWN